MINVIQSDLYKLRRSRPIKILFLLMWIAAGVVAAISYLMAKGTVGYELSGPISGLTDIMMVAIVGPFLAGVYICGDFDNKMIHDAVSSCGLSRGAVVLAKSVVYYALVILMLVPYAVVTVIASATGAEFSQPFANSVFLGILADNSGLDLSAGLFGKMLAIMLVMMIAYAAEMSICVLLAFLLRRSSLVIFIGFGAILVLQILGGIGTKLGIVQNILSYTPFSVGSANLTMETETMAVLKALGISLIFVSWLMSITNGLFRKSEIK